MAIETGSRLGSYEIVAPLGAGGMGEVYRARDPRLGRDVAIKLLPDAFADDAERLARFEREARLLASLQHANIAVLYGLEESAGRRFLVMQCIEGESLAERLRRGALPVAEALEIGAAVAAALEAAHETGIVHRDLKPGNIMVTPGGEVKVLDFGLAKAGPAAAADASLSSSPTRTDVATHAGAILGTAAYMSPEQARGRPVDRRADIWSFGCVLYEMLAGGQAFPGETLSDSVARILQAEPDWDALPAATPARVRELIVRCLQKDARRRLRDVGDARLELEDAIAGRASSSDAHPAPPAATRAPRRGVVLVTVVVAILSAVAVFAVRERGAGPVEGPARFTVSAPRGQTIAGNAAAVQISPDGRTLAVIASDSSGVPRIWVRRLDMLAPRLLPGTENVSLMFWSPDSRSIGFFVNDRKLERIAIAGGDPKPICDVKVARGGTWNRDGVILLAPYANGGIYRVPANGGDPVPVVHPDSAHGETALRFPVFLPDGRHFLFSSLPMDSERKVRVCIASLDGRERRVVLRAESGAVYADPGWLLYLHRGVIDAQRVDSGSLRPRGDPIPLGDLVRGMQFTGGPAVSASATGALAYAPYDPTTQRFAWFDLAGHEQAGVPNVKGVYFRAQLSPDGRRALCIDGSDGTQSFVALVDLERGTVSRVTADDASANEMNWAPDGRRFVCIEEARRNGVFVHSIDGDSGQAFLTGDPSFKRIDDWSRDGRDVIYERLDSATKWDLWALPVDGSGPPRPLVHTPANEENSTLSPDGRWLAYMSDASGTREIYVLPFGAPGPRYQVTNSGGTAVGWSRDGRLIFSASDRPDVVMVAAVVPGAVFALGKPEVLATVPGDNTGYDFDRTARRLLALVPAEHPRAQGIVVVERWPKALPRP